MGSHVTGVFAQFERDMIRQRVSAGHARAKDAIERDGRFVTNAGIVRTRLAPAVDQPGDGAPGAWRARQEHRDQQDASAHRC